MPQMTRIARIGSGSLRSDRVDPDFVVPSLHPWDLCHPWLEINGGNMTETLGVIWDVDGTLVDTAELHFRAWVALAGEIEKPFTRADFAATFGRRNPEIIRQLFGADLDDAAVTDLGHRKETHYRGSVVAEGTALLPGVARLLAEF